MSKKLKQAHDEIAEKRRKEREAAIEIGERTLEQIRKRREEQKKEQA